jgi:hypothetical protein
MNANTMDEERHRGPLAKELWFPRLIVVPLSSQEVDGVRKEKERLTTARPKARPLIKRRNQMWSGT